MAHLPWIIPRQKDDTYKDRPRGTPSGSPYHTYRWTKLSKAFRADHPLCAECNRKGIIRAATCVDHIIPWPICGDRFFDRTNLQSLCEKCNNEKGQRDKKRIQEWRKQNEHYRKNPRRD